MNTIPGWAELVNVSGMVYGKHPFECTSYQRRLLRTFVALERIKNPPADE